MGRGVYLRHPSSLEHDTGGHPENADRIRAIEAELAGRDWLGMEVVEAPQAKQAELRRIHPDPHIESIRELSERGGGMIDFDTVTSAGSYEAALHSAGGAIEAVDRLLGGEAKFAFCGLRPPGHHAESAQAMGFCLFNNIAVGAAHALDAHGAERVLILDWDVHHGNGTNDIFSDSAAVLYCSIHQSPLYPGTGPITDSGRGAGEGHTLNMPVPPGAGPAEFEALVQHVVAPVVAEWRPRLVAISAGFDAHRDDPLANCELDEASYANMAARMRAAAAGVGAPVLVCLEGGYDLQALARSVAAMLEALAHEADPRDAAPGPAEPYRERFSRWWSSLS